MALTLNGSTGQVDCGNNLNFAAGASLTITAWIRRAATGVRHEIVNKENNASVLGYSLFVSTANQLSLALFNGSSPTAVGTTSLAASTTYFVAGTYDGTTTRVFVNGVQEGTTSAASAGNTHTTTLRLGARSIAGSFFNGVLEDVRIYTRALSADELLTIYSSLGNDGIVYGLGGRWGLAEGAPAATPTTVPDYGDSKFTGTVSGSPTYAENLINALAA